MVEERRGGREERGRRGPCWSERMLLSFPSMSQCRVSRGAGSVAGARASLFRPCAPSPVYLDPCTCVPALVSYFQRPSDASQLRRCHCSIRLPCTDPYLNLPQSASYVELTFRGIFSLFFPPPNPAHLVLVGALSLSLRVKQYPSRSDFIWSA